MTQLVPDLPRRAWIVLGGDMVAGVGSGMVMPFFIVYLHRVRGISLPAAGLALRDDRARELRGKPDRRFTFRPDRFAALTGAGNAVERPAEPQRLAGNTNEEQIDDSRNA